MAVALLPVLLLIDSAIAFARGWKTESRLDFAVIGFAALAVCAIAVIQGWARCRQYLGQRWAQLVVLVGVGSVTWLVAETVLAICLPAAPPAQFHLRSPGLRRVFLPNPSIFPGVTGESHFTVNSQGVRGSEMPSREAAFRILCIGGSTTECIYLDDAEAWPALVMQKLNQSQRQPVWVGSIGISGFSSLQHLRFLEQTSLLPVEQSDIPSQIDCLVMLVGVNDLLRQLRGELESDFRDHWKDADAKDRQARPLWRESPLLNVVRKAYYSRGRDEVAVEDPVGGHYQMRRRQRQAATICEAIPDLTVALAEYESRLRAIVRACRAKRLRLVFLTQPALWNESMSAQARSLLWLGWLGNGQYLSIECLREGLDRHNEILRRVSNELGVECVDLTQMNGREDFFYDDCHFNERGAEEVARLVSDWFVQHPIEWKSK